MIYDIRHVTAYRYASPVASARCTLRLAPAANADQRVIAHAVDIAPAATCLERPAFGGGREVFATVAIPHDELRIEARSRVEVTRRPPERGAAAPPWEAVREMAFAADSLGAEAPAHYLFPSRLVSLGDPLTAYAAARFGPGRDVLRAALDLMSAMKADFVFDPQATHVATTPAEAFARRRGVCQDFAHVMIAGLRGLGLPAAYVSGYLRTLPPPGRPRLQGADASHAWVSLWCGPSLGWIGLDPTNGCLVAGDHVELAKGRDYADVSPIDGVIVGGGAQSVHVAVDVVPVQEESKRAATRTAALDE